MTNDPNQPTPVVMPVMFRVTASSYFELADVWEDDGVIDPSCEGMGNGTMLITARGVLVELPADRADAHRMLQQLRTWAERRIRPVLPDETRRAMENAESLLQCVQVTCKLLESLRDRVEPTTARTIDLVVGTCRDTLGDIEEPKP